MKAKLDIGTLAGFLPLALGASGFGGYILTRMVEPGPGISPPALVLSVAVLFLSAVCASLAVALVAQVVCAIGGYTVGFWPRLSILMQEFSVWIVVPWGVVWGVPFVLAMTVFFESSRHYPGLVAALLSIASAVILMLLFHKLFPREVVRTYGRFNPARSLGWSKGLLLFLLFTSVGHLFVHTRYIFDVEVPETTLEASQPVEVRARLSGRISNHHDLQVIVASTDPSGWRSNPVTFHAASEGNYVAWVEISGAPPGTYAVDVRFAHWAKASPMRKLQLWRAHNHHRKVILIRIKPLSTFD